MTNEIHIHFLLDNIEEGQEELPWEDESIRCGPVGTVHGTVDYPGPYGDLARFGDEDARYGMRPTHLRSPILDEDQQEELALVFREMGMSPEAARVAARGRHVSV